MKRKTIAIACVGLLALFCGCATPAQRHTWNRLSQIVIPDVDIRCSNIYDVILLLAEVAATNGAVSSAPAGGKAVIFTYFAPVETTSESTFRSPPSQDFPLVIMRGKNVTLGAAFEAVCHDAGLRFEIDRNGLIHIKGPRNRPSTTTCPADGAR